MTKDRANEIEPRRGAGEADEAYLKRVGDRVRLERARRGLSRKALSEMSGVSERYLAELERGAGNASLLVVRDIARAMSVRVADLASDEADRSIDLSLVIDDPAEETALPGETSRPPALASSRRLALIGLRGAGKTTVGQTVAKALGTPFVELDREIERASGMALADALAARGPLGFRRLEHNLLEAAIIAHERAVIAAGGGIVTESETFDLLLAGCFVVWLKASPEQIVRRAMAAGHLRPTARNRRVLDELRLVLDSRAPLYGRAHAEVDTTSKTLDEVVAAVAEIARRRPG